MKKIAVLFADGTEEIEALIPVDVLRRSGFLCDIISVSGKIPTSSHKVKIVADKIIEETDFTIYDGIVIPGGMPGAINIANSTYAERAIKSLNMQGKLIASICASPAVVLKKFDVIKGPATCYPAPEFIEALGFDYTGKDVEIYKNVITANGPKTAMAFSFEICKYFDVVAKI